MRLHEDTEQFSTLIAFTAEYFRISPMIYIIWQMTKNVQNTYSPLAFKMIYKNFLYMTSKSLTNLKVGRQKQ
jgi:hypothetical protein